MSIQKVNKTVFITGASTGIGLETAKLFIQKGWNVAATMRNPANHKVLKNTQHVKLIPCDVTDKNSINNAVKSCVETFGKIDVLINNAGFYTIGPFEVASMEQIDKQLDTNLRGTLWVTQEVLPYMRKQNSGVVINVSSIAGRMSIPMQTLYHATKWGVEGFSESLQYELSQFNIRVKIIEPGVIATDFYGRSKTIMKDENITEYDTYANKVVNNLVENGKKGSSPEDVAKTIYIAAIDGKKKMRYPTGKSKGMPMLRHMLPVGIYMKMVNNTMAK